MNVLELMDDVIHALNQLPNTRLSGRFRNTYGLVAALEQAKRYPAGNPGWCVTGASQGRFCPRYPGGAV